MTDRELRARRHRKKIAWINDKSKPSAIDLVFPPMPGMCWSLQKAVTGIPIGCSPQMSISTHHTTIPQKRHKEIDKNS